MRFEHVLPLIDGLHDQMIPRLVSPAWVQHPFPVPQLATPGIGTYFALGNARRGMMRSMSYQAWTPIPDYERYWTPFDDHFAFRPHVSPEVRPGILEPSGSVTLSLKPIFEGRPPVFATGAAAVNAEVLRAFVSAFDDTDNLGVLDWQHQGYWFRPHVHALTEEPWRVSPFPNGDYYIFLTEDMMAGTFGHPWEQSLCVFGEALVDQLVPALSSWLPILRRKGGPSAGAAAERIAPA